MSKITGNYDFIRMLGTDIMQLQVSLKLEKGKIYCLPKMADKFIDKYLKIKKCEIITEEEADQHGYELLLLENFIVMAKAHKYAAHYKGGLSEMAGLAEYGLKDVTAEHKHKNQGGLPGLSGKADYGFRPASAEDE